MTETDVAEQNHWSERGRATSVGNANALGRPRRSVLSFGVFDRMSDKIKLFDGETMLIMVQSGEVIHFTPNMGLPHSEFVKRTTGQLRAGAWVGTVSKLDDDVAAITSKHFFGYQLPAPPEVMEAVRRRFE